MDLLTRTVNDAAKVHLTRSPEEYDVYSGVNMSFISELIVARVAGVLVAWRGARVSFFRRFAGNMSRRVPSGSQ